MDNELLPDFFASKKSALPKYSLPHFSPFWKSDFPNIVYRTTANFPVFFNFLPAFLASKKSALPPIYFTSRLEVGLPKYRLSDHRKLPGLLFPFVKQKEIIHQSYVIKYGSLSAVAVVAEIAVVFFDDMFSVGGQ